MIKAEVKTKKQEKPKHPGPGYCDDTCRWVKTCSMKVTKENHVMKLDLDTKCRFFKPKK